MKKLFVLCLATCLSIGVALALFTFPLVWFALIWLDPLAATAAKAFGLV